MGDKRYTGAQAFRLLQRLIDVRAEATHRFRAFLIELLNARLGDYVTSASAQKAVAGADDATVAAFQQRVAKVLEHQEALARHRIGVRISTAATVTGGGDDIRVELSGTWEQQAVFHIVLLIRSVGRDRLRRCDCGRFFVREGKRLYCSLPCQKRFYMRRWRAGEAGEE